MSYDKLSYSSCGGWRKTPAAACFFREHPQGRRKIIRQFPLLGCFVIILLNSKNFNNCNKASAAVDRDSIFASYQYTAPDGFAGTTIVLKKDKSYAYSSGTDIQKYFSNGSWILKNDTLIMNSFFQRNDMPVSIKEIKSGTDSLIIAWVKDLDKNIIKGATFLFNRDTTKTCMPTLDECRFAKGSVKSIKLLFNNQCSTKWYDLKDLNSDKIEAVVNINFSPDNYEFFVEKKFIIDKGRLYDLRQEIEVSDGVSKMKFVKEDKFFYKKIK